jgi:protein-S-isoprenylcysteine O-methyltransferase Ste14
MLGGHVGVPQCSMKTSRVPPPLWTLIFGVAMWALNHYSPLLTIIPEPWNLLGWRLMIIAAVPPVAAFLQFWRANTTINPVNPEATSTLVTTGAYAWTRNPMYLGLSILLLGWAIRLGTLSPFVGPLLFAPLIARVQIRPEEYALRMRFGKDYDHYCQRVNRWIGQRRRA